VHAVGGVTSSHCAVAAIFAWRVAPCQVLPPSRVRTWRPVGGRSNVGTVGATPRPKAAAPPGPKRSLSIVVNVGRRLGASFNVIPGAPGTAERAHAETPWPGRCRRHTPPWDGRGGSYGDGAASNSARRLPARRLAHVHSLGSGGIKYATAAETSVNPPGWDGVRIHPRGRP